MFIKFAFPCIIMLLKFHTRRRKKKQLKWNGTLFRKCTFRSIKLDLKNSFGVSFNYEHFVVMLWFVGGSFFCSVSSAYIWSEWRYSPCDAIAIRILIISIIHAACYAVLFHLLLCRTNSKRTQGTVCISFFSAYNERVFFCFFPLSNIHEHPSYDMLSFAYRSLNTHTMYT